MPDFWVKNIDLKNFDGVIMSSVQPSLNYTIGARLRVLSRQKPIMVGVGIKTGLNIRYANPQEVGADRIVNSVAAYRLYGGPCIVVDFWHCDDFQRDISQRRNFWAVVLLPA